ncbi:LacI family DNA-binding transcriptional regulator [Streptomyces sp. DSM 44915]|uniref:LacI family DNA-binding transcriptional regulator n=1 Tax=Streptomyces chisholmiae TaxID=3075540 RepID=A0ABU2JNQ9_9ACTN|nr:LacI family DNA-binding transcriptional regulator [Streptomyces sp. DSM 44915]MDT0265868.1 LacI family DNA-binding transcriptional regulator [Streptomyces sp. DSM 44915]
MTTEPLGGGRTAPRRPTMREVARLAGVSHQTVSRYFKADDTIHAELRQRISVAVAQLGYRPNLVARAMRNRRTGRLSFLLPPGTAASSLELLAGAQEEAHRAGYGTEVFTLDGPLETRAERALELADSGFYEGILALTPLPLDTRRAAGDTPIVIAPHYDQHMRSIGQLADAPDLDEIITRLAALGHRRFLHLGGDYRHTSARRRRDVYLETIDRLGLRSHAVIDCAWRAELAHRAILDLPADSGVTAVVAANDVVAVGAISAALARGWRVPEDLSVTGWDNNPVGAAMTPSLTTVSVDHEELGRRVSRELLATVREEPVPEENEGFTRVFWRSSTGPARSDTGGASLGRGR